ERIHRAVAVHVGEDDHLHRSAEVGVAVARRDESRGAGDVLEAPASVVPQKPARPRPAGTEIVPVGAGPAHGEVRPTVVVHVRHGEPYALDPERIQPPLRGGLPKGPHSGSPPAAGTGAIGKDLAAALAEIVPGQPLVATLPSLARARPGDGQDRDTCVAPHESLPCKRYHQ